MTRGKFALFLPHGRLLLSIEFNGGMYLEGHGSEAAVLLSQVQSEQDFRTLIVKFNEAHHNYPDIDEFVYEISPSESDSYRNLDEEYFDKWFSDYLFIKNLSGESLDFRLRGTPDKVLKLDDNDFIVFNFGNRAEDFDTRFKKSYTVL